MTPQQTTNGAPLPHGMDTFTYQQIRLERCCVCDMMAAKAMAARKLAPATFFEPADDTDDPGHWQWRCKCFCINVSHAGVA